MNWTQPICDICWVGLNPERHPIRVTEPEVETCAFCGNQTYVDIYIRVDPRTVPYPKGDE